MAGDHGVCAQEYLKQLQVIRRQYHEDVRGIRMKAGVHV